ncbi:hypothetical protein C7271_18945 [filamentous cyanobacterium CCP5]|nr:hypothetical protein C7271_18945 [filamentous cyanobacterium CCP5]
MSPYNRRQVLKLAGLATGAAALPMACRRRVPRLDEAAGQKAEPEAAIASPEPTTEAALTDISRVVLIKTDDRVAGTQQALDLLQPDGIAGQTVFLKPNYNTGDPAPAATDTALLETLVKELQAAGAGAMTIGDRSGMADTRAAMTQKGVFELSDRYGLNAIVFDEMDTDQWQYFDAEGTHWQQGFAFARPILDAGAVVNTCCLKTHRYGGHFTLSLKNTVGAVAKYVPGDPYNYMSELHSSAHQRRMIAEINAAYQPALILMDGVEAFVKGGPASGDKVPANVILAGTDRIAVDTVAIGILRSLGTTSEVSQGSVWDLEQVQRAVELGLGVASSEQIEVVTNDTASQKMADEVRSHMV